MRAFLIAATAAALAFPAAAQVIDAAKVRAAYERLCTGDAPGSEASCSALRDELDKAGVPGTVGWSGMLIGLSDDGAKASRVFAVDPSGPAAKAGIRTGDVLAAIDGTPVTDPKLNGPSARKPLAGQLVRLTIVRGDQILNVPVKLAEQPKPDPKLNAQRTEARSYSVMKALNGVKSVSLTVDKIRVGEAFYGVLEDSDASSDWGKREDCLEVAEAGAKNLVAYVTPNATPMRIYAMQGRCDYGLSATSAQGADIKKPFGLYFATQAGAKTYLMVSGASSAAPYQVIVREQTAKETLGWREQIRQNQIAAQQQREAQERAAADRRQMWGAALTGLVSGFAGVEAPLMREDGSAPNLLETLNAANAALERKNAEGAARLNETIARAQAQADWQRRQREEADRDAVAQRQAERQRKDRELATQVIGQGRQQIQQTLQQARASGDKALEQRALQALETNEAYAREKGVGSEVRQYAGQGKLGQTPLGGFPAPITAPKPQPSTQVAQSGSQAQGAKLRCFSPNPDGALVCPEDRARPGQGGGNVRVADGRTPGQGAPGAGGTGSGGTGSQPRPPANQPPTLRPPGTLPVAETEIRPESITLCRLEGPQAQFNNWRCTGSLQMNYVNFEKPNWQAQLHMTCGGNRPMRDLGTAGGYRAFGCGFPLPTSDDGDGADIPARFGVGYVAGRISYRCPKGSTRNCQAA